MAVSCNIFRYKCTSILPKGLDNVLMFLQHVYCTVVLTHAADGFKGVYCNSVYNLLLYHELIKVTMYWYTPIYKTIFN